MDSRVRKFGAVRTELLFDIVIDLDPRSDFGEGPVGRRVLFASAGGTFEGPKLRGNVLRGGGDWAQFRSDGVMALDVRLALRTHDDALVYMTYGGRLDMPPGLRADAADPAKRSRLDPARYYFRTNPLFETGARNYAWLNRIVCIGEGYLVEGGVAYRVSQVL